MGMPLPSTGKASKGQIARHLQRVENIGKKYGVQLNEGEFWGKSRKEIEEAAKRKAGYQKKRAGVKALVKKYGAKGAANIVYKHSGRRIREAPAGWTPPVKR
jgi:hypothetical protein